jgi:hypothetical protein
MTQVLPHRLFDSLPITSLPTGQHRRVFPSDRPKLRAVSRADDDVRRALTLANRPANSIIRQLLER